ncbi:MAG: DUF72 domain-containing protein [Bryobacteraceae bacterium]
MKQIYIGTSGWHYKHWLGTFYPAGLPASRMLSFYLERFDTVELNNSFYRLPPEKALDNWRESTPHNFIFAMKGSRFLTHMKKLKDPEPGLERFFARADRIDGKLGPIVFQLQPNWPLNLDRLQAFLKALPPHRRYAFEFRNASWSTPEVYALLRAHEAAYCIFEIAGIQSPREITAGFVYVRLHGPGGRYQGSYDDAALRRWTDWIGSVQPSAAYFYFDNDEAGYAPRNALRLKQLISERNIRNALRLRGRHLAMILAGVRGLLCLFR